MAETLIVALPAAYALWWTVHHGRDAAHRARRLKALRDR